jgi:hypothetical protein
MVSQYEWERLMRITEKCRPTVENDYSNGGHGCVLGCDLWDMMRESRIVEKNPSSVIRRFVRKISDDQFLDMVREWVEEFETQVFVVWDSDANHPQVFRTREQALKMTHDEGGGGVYVVQIVDDKSDEKGSNTTDDEDEEDEPSNRGKGRVDPAVKADQSWMRSIRKKFPSEEDEFIALKSSSSSSV